MIFNVKGKSVDVRFNFQTVFRINEKLGSKNENGEPQNDGVGLLFARLQSDDDSAVLDLIELSAPSNLKLTRNDAVDALASYFDLIIQNTGVDEETAYRNLFDQLTEEAIASGFFAKKLRDYKETAEKALEIVQEKKQTDETKAQKKALTELVTQIGDALSSPKGQESE